MSPLGTFLNGRSSTQLRGLAFLSLSDVAVVQSRTMIPDTGGGARLMWSDAGTVACRVDVMGAGAGSRMVGGAIDERSTHMVHAPVGSTITLTDRLLVTNRGTFEITAVNDRSNPTTQVYEAIQL